MTNANDWQISSTEVVHNCKPKCEAIAMDLRICAHKTQKTSATGIDTAPDRHNSL
jgi:hypothetical protein